MHIREYIQKRGIYIPDFAKRCKVSTASIYAYIQEQRAPHARTAARISKQTKGMVTVEELMAFSNKGKDD